MLDSHFYVNHLALTHAIPALLAEPVGSNLPCDDCHPNNVTTRALSRGNRHVHV